MAYKSFLNCDKIKKEEFKKNQDLIDLLSELKELLTPIQQKKQNNFNSLRWPVGFIIGNPRSGTSLLLQWLASLGIFSYPSNFLTRFAYAPYIGALIQKMLFDKNYDFHEELYDINSGINFESNLGKSKGALATNEFQHFFRTYMPNFDPEYIDKDQLKKVDFIGIKKGICSIQKAFGKPFILKGVMLQNNIQDLVKNIPDIIFFYIKRDPKFNMQSLLLAREKYFDDRSIWWSVKPKQYKFLKNMDIYHQIAGQVYYTNKSIQDELNMLPKEKKIEVQYEEFCQNPKDMYDKIVDIYGMHKYKIDSKYTGPEKYDVRNTIELEKKENEELEKSYFYFENSSNIIKN